MARRSGLVRAIAQAQREAERMRIDQERAQTQAAKAAAQAQKAYQRAQIADQKERARLYAESRAAQVAMQNDELELNICLETLQSPSACSFCICGVSSRLDKLVSLSLLSSL